MVTANRVVACSHSARSAGVRRGQRRREAQARCPELAVLARDEAAEACLFEPIVAALESIAPGVEITRPGLAAIGARGPNRYFGGEQGVLLALSRAIADRVADVLIGIADGAFAAEQAARRGMIVAPGQSGPFLAELPISTLAPSDESALIDLLNRLGLRTLGAFAALPPRDVLARFGPDGAWAHRQAGGRDDRPVAARRPPREYTVTLDLEPPLERIDTIAFTARSAVERFVGTLAEHGLACTCFELLVSTDQGEQTQRRWRHTGVLTAVDVIDRIRWQLQGWRASTSSPTGAIVGLRLTPLETVPTGVHQQSLWGGSGAADEQARRGLARVQTLLGPGSVLLPTTQGGRTPGQSTRLVPWGDELTPLRSPTPPWPGRLPAPAPSVLFDPPRPVQVLDANGVAVQVSDSGVVPQAPARLVTGTSSTGSSSGVPITAWAGPWPIDERWWEPEAPPRIALFQLVDVRGQAYLASCQLGVDGSRWTIEAIYD